MGFKMTRNRWSDRLILSSELRKLERNGCIGIRSKPFPRSKRDVSLFLLRHPTLLNQCWSSSPATTHYRSSGTSNSVFRSSAKFGPRHTSVLQHHLHKLWKYQFLSHQSNQSVASGKPASRIYLDAFIRQRKRPTRAVVQSSVSRATRRGWWHE